MSAFFAFIIGFIMGGLFGVLCMALYIVSKKERGNYFLPDDD